MTEKELDNLKEKTLKAYDAAEKHENDLVRALKVREDESNK